MAKFNALNLNSKLFNTFKSIEKYYVKLKCKK